VDEGVPDEILNDGHELPDVSDAFEASSWTDIVKALILTSVGFALLALVAVAYHGFRRIARRAPDETDEPLIGRRP
jgi:hypothetical protein